MVFRNRGAVFKVRGPIHLFLSVVGGGKGAVGLWTFKMVYLVPTKYFLIQLQLINHFFKNSLTNEKGRRSSCEKCHFMTLFKP